MTTTTTGELVKFTVPQEIERKILTAIELKKELEAYETEIKESLKQAMIDHDVYSIKNDSYSVTLATRTSYKAKEVPEDFVKVSLDVAKVGTYEKLYGELPEGVEKSETKYITWRAK